MESMNDIINFLKNDIWGLIILAVVSSLLAALLYDTLKKIYNRLVDYRQDTKKKKLITQSIKYYSEGFTAGYAWNSTYQQSVLTGYYLIRFILQIGAILFSTIIFVASLILIGQPFSWIITIVFSIVLTLQYRRLREMKEMYSVYMEKVFGDDFKKDLSKYSTEHIKNKIGNKKNNR